MDAALREVKRFRYVPGYFIKMRREMGTLNDCRALIGTSEVSEGFTPLALEGRLDLSVDAIALRFPELFSQPELDTTSGCRPRAPTSWPNTCRTAR